MTSTLVARYMIKMFPRQQVMTAQVTIRSTTKVCSTTHLVSPNSELPHKDDGNIYSIPSPSASETLDLPTTEQSIRLHIRDANGDSDIITNKVQLVPQWHLDKAVEGEQTNYLTTCSPVHFRDLPAQSNDISSHFFFSIKHSSYCCGA
jgi:hypothetical protein